MYDLETLIQKRQEVERFPVGDSRNYMSVVDYVKNIIYIKICDCAK